MSKQKTRFNQKIIVHFLVPFLVNRRTQNTVNQSLIFGETRLKLSDNKFQTWVACYSRHVLSRIKRLMEPQIAQKKKQTNKKGRKRGNLEKLNSLIYNSVISKSYVLPRKLPSLERLNNEKAWVARRTLTSGKVY